MLCHSNKYCLLNYKYVHILLGVLRLFLHTQVVELVEILCWLLKVELEALAFEKEQNPTDYQALIKNFEKKGNACF